MTYNVFGGTLSLTQSINHYNEAWLATPADTAHISSVYLFYCIYYVFLFFCSSALIFCLVSFGELLTHRIVWFAESSICRVRASQAAREQTEDQSHELSVPTQDTDQRWSDTAYCRCCKALLRISYYQKTGSCFVIMAVNWQNFFDLKWHDYSLTLPSITTSSAEAMCYPDITKG